MIIQYVWTLNEKKKIEKKISTVEILKHHHSRSKWVNFTAGCRKKLSIFYILSVNVLLIKISVDAFISGTKIPEIYILVSCTFPQYKTSVQYRALNNT